MKMILYSSSLILGMGVGIALIVRVQVKYNKGIF